VALKNDAAAETSKNQLSRRFSTFATVFDPKATPAAPDDNDLDVSVLPY